MTAGDGQAEGGAVRPALRRAGPALLAVRAALRAARAGEALREERAEPRVGVEHVASGGEEDATARRDFDQVVLGIAVGALPRDHGGAVRVTVRSSWRTMLDNATPPATQAMQLWMNINLEETGWPLASPILDAYAEPFNTWAADEPDPRQGELAPERAPVRHRLFCDNMAGRLPLPPFTNHAFPAREDRAGQGSTRGVARAEHGAPVAVRHSRRRARSSGRSSSTCENRGGAARLEGSTSAPASTPRERYVRNAARADQHRLPAGGSGFPTYLTGDWVDNGSLNLGCVESTVIAGCRRRGR